MNWRACLRFLAGVVAGFLTFWVLVLLTGCACLNLDRASKAEREPAAARENPQELSPREREALRRMNTF